MVWPIEPGEYSVASEQKHIAVCTLANEITLPCTQVAIVGHNMTENLGLERIVINIISNSNIRYLIICGDEIQGHNSGQSLISLWKNGIDNKNKIIGAKGAIPVIQNIPELFIKRFQKQVKLVDMIGITDPGAISNKISKLASVKTKPYNGEKIDFDKHLMKPEIVGAIPEGLSASIVSVAEECEISLNPTTGRLSD